MASPRPSARHWRPRPMWLAASVAAVALLGASVPAHALRVVTWNLLNYTDANIFPPPINTITPRQPSFRTVMASLSCDVIVTQELMTDAAADSFLLNVLEVAQPSRGWTRSSYQSAAQGAVFYDSLAVSVSNVAAFMDGGPRQVLLCLVRPNGYLSNLAAFRLYSMHLKAGGPGTPDSTTRRIECTNIRNNLNNVTTTLPNFLLAGDTNFYGAYEGGYTRLTESRGGAIGNNGRCKDPFNMLVPDNWHVQPQYARFDTQCPCLNNCPGALGFAGGGLDDRFDVVLSSYSLQDGQGLDLVSPDSCYAYGNDNGAHFNDDIDAGGYNNAVGLPIADALIGASDHLPVIFVLQLPSKISAFSSLDFGSAILGAAPVPQSLTVSNAAGTPADALDFSISASAGFSAPTGSFSAPTGLPSTQTLSMSAASLGPKSGTLTIASDDPDSSAKSVLLSGRVLAHASASLDSAVLVRAATLDFGEHVVGGFSDHAVRVHDQGYNSLLARLAVTGGAISGGGKFSIVGGFTPALIAGVGTSYSIHFDPAGGRLDSLYEATLTLSSADEPLPGATPQPDLTVALRAWPVSAVTGAPGDVYSLRFEPPRPNPVVDLAELAFELPRAAHVSLAVFDLTGRRVASLASGEFEPGRHALRWNARDNAGRRVPAGLYFLRFETAGLECSARLAVLP